MCFLERLKTLLPGLCTAASGANGSKSSFYIILPSPFRPLHCICVNDRDSPPTGLSSGSNTVNVRQSGKETSPLLMTNRTFHTRAEGLRDRKGMGGTVVTD